MEKGVRIAVGVGVGVGDRRSLGLARHTLFLAQFLFICYCEQTDLLYSSVLVYIVLILCFYFSHYAFYPSLRRYTTIVFSSKWSRLC